MGFVPLGARALEECGKSGIPMRWGAQRNPSKRLGASAQIIARQPPGDSMEKNKDPASFLQDIHHFLCFPGGDSGPSQASLWATSSKRLCSWPPAGVGSFPHVFMEHLLYAEHGVGSLGNVLSCLSGICDIFGGAFQAGIGEHVILNTCSFYLLVASK